jgi:hypothetical protein
MTTRATARARGPRDGDRLLRNSGWLAGLDRVNFGNGNGKAASGDNSHDTMRVATDMLNVRAGPTTEARVLGTLGRGASARVINSQGGWRELRIPGKPGRGWVAAFLIAGEVAEPRGERAARVGQSGG